jgi:hypothetical protein
MASAAISAADAIAILEAERVRRFVEISVDGFALVATSVAETRRTPWEPEAPEPNPGASGSSKGSGSSVEVMVGAALGALLILVVAVIVLRRARKAKDVVRDTRVWGSLLLRGSPASSHTGRMMQTVVAVGKAPDTNRSGIVNPLCKLRYSRACVGEQVFEPEHLQSLSVPCPLFSPSRVRATCIVPDVTPLPARCCHRYEG